MKKIYGFLGAAALLSMVACSKDADLNGPKGPEGNKGDMYMSMIISQQSGTRTATPDQGKEIGQNYENTLADALIIFGRPDGTVFKAIHVGTNDIVGTESPYATTFEASRDEFIKDIKDKGSDKGSDGDKEITYNIYVVGNPTDDMVSKFTAVTSATTPAVNVQDVFELTEDNGENSYWKNDHFLMSNATVTEKKIALSDIPVGTHTTAGKALPLGEVTIQRAMSRFDIDVEHVAFSAENSNSELKDITITFDAVALVNQATKANLYKVTSTEGEPTTVENETDRDDLKQEYANFVVGKTLNFTAETASNYVFSPVQTAFTCGLFDGNIVNGAYNPGEGENKTGKATPKAFTSFTYTPFSAINKEDKPDYDVPNNWEGGRGTYYIWRYCMENTNFDKDNQVHGNTTGIVFRAKMTSSTITANGGENVDLYAFSNVILGKAETLRAYVINQKPENDESGIYELVGIRYKAAVAAYNKSLGEDKETPSENAAKLTFEVDKTDDPDKGDWTKPEGSELAKGYTDIRKANTTLLAALNPFLVDYEFTIYEPTMDNGSPVYYCYYTYWNRHNDNGADNRTIMGPMEFATVRNNVYKLAVTKINTLGHPGDPNNDPDPEDPGDPDEKDHFYFSVSCVILPWEVRINEIEF